jgi:hypothetical protein
MATTATRNGKVDSDTAALEAEVKRLTGMVTKLTSMVDSLNKLNEPAEPSTHDIADQKAVAKFAGTKGLSKFFKNGDANEPASYRQKTRLMALGHKTDWADLQGLSTAQAAVASYHLEAGDAVKIDDLVIIPR